MCWLRPFVKSRLYCITTRLSTNIRYKLGCKSNPHKIIMEQKNQYHGSRLYENIVCSIYVVIFGPQWSYLLSLISSIQRFFPLSLSLDVRIDEENRGSAAGRNPRKPKNLISSRYTLYTTSPRSLCDWGRRRKKDLDLDWKFEVEEEEMLQLRKSHRVRFCRHFSRWVKVLLFHP